MSRLSTTIHAGVAANAVGRVAAMPLNAAHAVTRIVATVLLIRKRLRIASELNIN